MAQYIQNLPNFAQGNYTYGNMNQWGVPQDPSGSKFLNADLGLDKNYDALQLDMPSSTLNPLQTPSPKFSLLPGGGAYGESGNALAGIGGGEQLSTLDPATMSGLNSTINPNLDIPTLGNEEPGVAGQWIEPAKFGLGAAKVGLGAYNAFQSAKMNKFMRNYYGDQMDLQKADFANSARSTNTALEGQRERQLDSQGYAAGTDANRSRVDEYMKQHGVAEKA